mmetsp:Transcript_19192/g.32132  ORF Transcript_19192/g.32132 Transcript_19192/m.32132 type:complete len:152 (-) Transcript_19192:174-629(-)
MSYLRAQPSGSVDAYQSTVTNTVFVSTATTTASPVSLLRQTQPTTSGQHHFFHFNNANHYRLSFYYYYYYQRLHVPSYLSFYIVWGSAWLCTFLLLVVVVPRFRSWWFRACTTCAGRDVCFCSINHFVRDTLLPALLGRASRGTTLLDRSR